MYRLTGLALMFGCASATGATTRSEINLICRGQASVDHDTVTSGRFGVMTTSGSESFDDSVGLKINGTGGEARLPRRMLPAVRTASGRGWFPLIHLQESADEINAQVRLNQYNKPRIRVDRITGAVRIDGPLGSYSGQCEAFDPDTAERKF